LNGNTYFQLNNFQCCLLAIELLRKERIQQPVLTLYCHSMGFLWISVGFTPIDRNYTHNYLRY
jgi:hypothetical protein